MAHPTHPGFTMMHPLVQGARLRGHTPQGGVLGTFWKTPLSEPLLRTLLRTLFYCKTHIRPPSQNPSKNPFPRTLPRTFSEPFLERCVAVRPLRRAPNVEPNQSSEANRKADPVCATACIKVLRPYGSNLIADMAVASSQQASARGVAPHLKGHSRQQ